jgi:hypothetical protein
MAYRNEDFDNYDQDGFFSSLKQTMSKAGPRLMVGGAVVALLVLGGVFWGAYPESDDAAQPVPVVRADIQPYKTTPEEPGGMDIAHRDSTVFSTYRDGQDAEKVENLLTEEGAEQPVPRSQLFAGLNTGAEDMPPQPAPAAADAGAADPAAMTEDKTAAAEQKPTDIQTAMDRSPAAEPAQTAPEAIEPAAGAISDAPEADLSEAAKAASQLEPAAGAATAAPKAVKPGTHYVQVASVRDSGKIPAEWKKLTAAHGGLKEYKYRTIAADLGAKGSFTRLQAGPMSKAEADTLCAAIKAKTPGGCMVVGK